MTAPTEKAAPIPAEVLRTASAIARRYASASLCEKAEEAIARAIMQDRADREARPSLPDSREERIREDEREACGKVVDDFGRTWGVSYRTMTDEIAKAVRARQGGNNG